MPSVITYPINDPFMLSSKLFNGIAVLVGDTCIHARTRFTFRDECGSQWHDVCYDFAVDHTALYSDTALGHDGSSRRFKYLA